MYLSVVEKYIIEEVKINCNRKIVNYTYVFLKSNSLYRYNWFHKTTDIFMYDIL